MDVLNIFGPPGTGKTRQLMEFAEKEGSGLFLSYTKAAAAEAVSRLPEGSNIRPSTVHSLAFNALSMNRAAVVDKEKLKAFAKSSGVPFKGTEDGSDEEQEGDQYVAVTSYARNQLMPDVMQAYEHFGCPGTRARYDYFVKSYESWKKTYGYMDFDDMLIHYALRKQGGARVVFIDEAQDCTPLQWKCINVACTKAEKVYVAGDDDQAIYEWSGANPHGMVEFMEEHKGEMMILAHSHRLPHSSWELATKTVATIKKRVPKSFAHNGADGSVEYYGFLDLALQKLDVLAPKGALILTRDRFKLQEVQRALNRDLIPYDVYGGMSPWTSKIAKAIRAKEKPEIPMAWREFYQQADLSRPIEFHLSTIHAAKGREHDTVIVDLDCPARVLSNIDYDRDAEVRVQYVGITRSKNKLILCGGNPII